MQPGQRPACLLPCSSASSIPAAPGLAVLGWQKEGSPAEPGPVSFNTFYSIPACSHPVPSPEHPWDCWRAERQLHRHPEGVPGQAPGKGSCHRTGGCLSSQPPRHCDSKQLPEAQLGVVPAINHGRSPQGCPGLCPGAHHPPLPVYLEVSPPRSAGWECRDGWGCPGTGRRSDPSLQPQARLGCTAAAPGMRMPGAGNAQVCSDPPANVHCSPEPERGQSC